MRLSRQVEEIYWICDLCGIECHRTCYYCERNVCHNCCEEDLGLVDICHKCVKTGEVFELDWKLKRENERHKFITNGIFEDWKTLSLKAEK